MKEKLSKLIDVKSITTLLLAITFTILALIGKINSEDVSKLFTYVIIFYYGTQVGKKEKEDDK